MAIFGIDRQMDRWTNATNYSLVLVNMIIISTYLIFVIALLTLWYARSQSAVIVFIGLQVG